MEKIAVIFDLDGTLIDSAPDLRAALNRTLAAAGLAPLSLAEVTSMIGDGAKILVERAFAARGVVAAPTHLAAFLADYEAHAVVETVVYPGIFTALETLTQAGYVLGVCTNKPEAAAGQVLAGLKLARYFSGLTGGDTTPYKKPDPRHLAAALEAIGTERAVMIGDHENDMKAAAGLGIPGIFAAWGYGAAQGDFTASCPENLSGLIAALG